MGPDDLDDDFDDDLDGLDDASDDGSEDIPASDDDPETDDEGADGGEGDSGDDDGFDATAVPATRGKNRISAKERIAQLVKRAKDAELAAFEAEMKLHAARQQPAPAEPEPPKKPDPEAFKYGEVDPDYLDAVVEYKVALREIELRKDAAKAQERAEQEALNAKYGKRLAEVMEQGKKRFPDFETVVLGTSYDALLARMVLDSENAVDIAYHLSNNVSELRKVTQMDYAERARYIGRLEGKLSAASAVRKKTKAPDPLGTNKTKSAETGKYGPDNQDDFDKVFYS